MQRRYSWPPIEALVEASDNAFVYKVTLLADDYQSTSVAVDAHWGADDAAKMTLEIFRRAFADPKRFMAEERMEARHMSRPNREEHTAWAENVVQGSAAFGGRLETAYKHSMEPQAPLDVSKQIEDYLGLIEIGHEMAINTLVSEGHTITEAREINAERTLRNFTNKWRLVPSRRLPTATHRRLDA